MRKERIIYLLLLVIFVSSLICAFRNKETISDFEIKRFWINKTHSKKKYPVVFGGDSRIYRGISPEAFTEAFPGMTAVNLGYSSNGFNPAYLDFIEEKLDKNAEDQVIVVGISPHNFTERGFKSEHYMREKNERKKEEVMQYMYLYKINRVLAPLKIMELFRDDEAEQISNEQYIYHLDGWMESWFIVPDTMKMRWVYSRTFAKNEYNAESAGAFFRRVREWTNEGITVVSFRTPASMGVRILEDSLSGMDFGLFKESFAEAGGDWLEFDRAHYPTYDGSHMDHHSAVAFSTDLATELRKVLERKR